jgi:ABC-type bacteriocin/lantibiotic exporter with double-glycine peptidase domain
LKAGVSENGGFDDFTTAYAILCKEEPLSNGISKEVYNMSMQPVPERYNLNQKPNLLKTIVMRLWPFAIGVVLVLFPFDWLSNVWPVYGQVFDRVFVSAREHHIGHSTLFLIVGLLILLSFPALRSRSLLYFGLMISAALAQEAVQDLFTLHLPSPADGLDLVFDAVGFTIAYLIVWLWRSITGWRKV